MNKIFFCISLFLINYIDSVEQKKIFEIVKSKVVNFSSKKKNLGLLALGGVSFLIYKFFKQSKKEEFKKNYSDLGLGKNLDETNSSAKETINKKENELEIFFSIKKETLKEWDIKFILNNFNSTKKFYELLASKFFKNNSYPVDSKKIEKTIIMYLKIYEYYLLECKIQKKEVFELDIFEVLLEIYNSPKDEKIRSKIAEFCVDFFEAGIKKNIVEMIKDFRRTKKLDTEADLNKLSLQEIMEYCKSNFNNYISRESLDEEAYKEYLCPVVIIKNKKNYSIGYSDLHASYPNPLLEDFFNAGDNFDRGREKFHGKKNEFLIILQIPLQLAEKSFLCGNHESMNQISSAYSNSEGIWKALISSDIKPETQNKFKFAINALEFFGPKVMIKFKIDEDSKKIYFEHVSHAAGFIFPDSSDLKNFIESEETSKVFFISKEKLNEKNDLVADLIWQDPKEMYSIDRGVKSNHTFNKDYYFERFKLQRDFFKKMGYEFLESFKIHGHCNGDTFYQRKALEDGGTLRFISDKDHLKKKIRKFEVGKIEEKEDVIRLMLACSCFNFYGDSNKLFLSNFKEFQDKFQKNREEGESYLDILPFAGIPYLVILYLKGSFFQGTFNLPIGLDLEKIIEDNNQDGDKVIKYLKELCCVGIEKKEK